jgi:arylsulfatase A-like enzyme
VRALPWRRLLPPRWSWVRLLASPSSATLLGCLILTAAVKVVILSGLEVGDSWLQLPWVLSLDAAVYLGLAAMFAVGEGRVPWIALATIPLSLLLATAAMINAAYLSVAGQQISWNVVSVGLERFDDFWSIAGEHVRHAGFGVVGAVPALVVAVMVPARVLVKRRGGPWSLDRHGRQRAHAAVFIAALAAIVRLAIPTPDPLPIRYLGGNAPVATYIGFLTEEDPDEVFFTGYRPPQLAAPEEVARLAAGTRPNVLLLVLESTRWDFTSLAGDGAPAATPQLAALAAAGAVAPTTRAVVPHTTKSLFSMLCGRLPLMQQALFELSPALEVECLPAVLLAAGYRTGFFQSAHGSFETRARLVANMGFEHFQAWEDIGGEPLGYLASDDESLGPAFASWLEADATEPFFATLLTSAPHHPYRLPAPVRERVRQSGAPQGSDRERYARLVEAEDHLLGAVLATLEERGLRERTIVVVAGDHGEGFGDKGVRQHDNNFYEEGLRVPLVFAGPGVPRGRIEGNVSLVDLAPSILHLLGGRAHDDGGVVRGVNVFAGVSETPRWFTCWYDLHCQGFVLGEHKVVHLPQLGETFLFDLGADPDETRARRADLDQMATVGQMRLLMRSLRIPDKVLRARPPVR